MSIEKYEQARQLIEDAGGGDFEGAKPETLVARAEAALGLTFPPSYRRFLLEMGCGDINGLEVFGLIDDNFANSTIPNGIWLTLHERRRLDLDPAYVFVGDAGDGAYYAIDTSNSRQDGEAQVIWLSMDGSLNDNVADSFGAFLLRQVQEIV